MHLKRITLCVPFCVAAAAVVVVLYIMFWIFIRYFPSILIICKSSKGQCSINILICLSLIILLLSEGQHKCMSSFLVSSQ